MFTLLQIFVKYSVQVAWERGLRQSGNIGLKKLMAISQAGWLNRLLQDPRDYRHKIFVCLARQVQRCLSAGWSHLNDDRLRWCSRQQQMDGFARHQVNVLKPALHCSTHCVTGVKHRGGWMHLIWCWWWICSLYTGNVCQSACQRAFISLISPHLTSPHLTSPQLSSFHMNWVRTDRLQPQQNWSLHRHDSVCRGYDQSQCTHFRWNEVCWDEVRWGEVGWVTRILHYWFLR